MKENDIIKVLFRDSTPVDVEVAPHVILEITETDPGLRGDTATGGSKPAILETGLKVTVPLFLNIGDPTTHTKNNKQHLLHTSTTDYTI